MTITANTRIQGTNPATGRLKYASGTGELVEYRETGYHGTVAVVRWTNGVETTHCRDLDNSNVSGLEFPAKLHEQPMADSPAAIARTDETPEQDFALGDVPELEYDTQLIAEIRTLAAKLDPNHLPTGLTKLRKPELESMLAALQLQDAEDEFTAWFAQTTDSRVGDEFGAEVDALVARELAADVPVGLAERVQFASTMWTRTTDIPTRDVVVVQSGSRLVWGKLINVVNRQTRYSAPLLATVELESGVRQLVAADDVLVA